MPDRLQELLQQRALIKEHLAWLESEIAAASGKPLPPPQPLNTGMPFPTKRPASSPTPTTQVPFEKKLRQDAEAEALLEKLAAQERPVPPPDKKGCWVIFSAVLLLIVGTVGFLLWNFYYKPSP